MLPKYGFDFYRGRETNPVDSEWQEKYHKPER